MGARKSSYYQQDQSHLNECVQFCAEVEALIAEDNKRATERESNFGKPTTRLSYVDAVLTIAEKRNIEPDLAAEFLNPDIKSKMAKEWEQKHRLKPKARLNFT